MARVPTQKKIRTRGPAANVHEPPVLTGEVLGSEYRDGEWGEPRRGAVETTSVFQVPTRLMASLIQRARDTNLPLLADPELERRMSKDGTHFISRVRQVHEQSPERAPKPGVYTWMRGHVRFALSDDPPNGYEIWLDFDATIIGQLIEQVARQNEIPQAVPAGMRGLPSMPTEPRWAGTYSFSRVFRHASGLAVRDAFVGGQKEVNTRQTMALSEALALAHAHVLCISPEQVAVLPEWESPQEVFDYCEELMLPFEHLYLDFTGPGMIAPTIATTYRQLKLYGALLWRHPIAGVLMVAPFGHPPDMETPVIESPGWFSFGALPLDGREGNEGRIVQAGEVQLMSSFDTYGVATTCWADACAGVEAGTNLPGYALIPHPKRKLIAAAEKTGIDSGEYLLRWGEILWLMASKALAALSIIEAAEVEFVDAPMEKRDRKRADKRGWPIAQQVIIRSHSKRYRGTNPPTGEEARYSHRFWRRATTAHYPLGTRMADAQPDLVTPCRRAPENNCGFCRKVRRPACIVGPEDRPLVLKTLVRRK